VEEGARREESCRREEAPREEPGQGHGASRAAEPGELHTEPRSRTDTSSPTPLTPPGTTSSPPRVARRLAELLVPRVIWRAARQDARVSAAGLPLAAVRCTRSEVLCSHGRKRPS